MEKPVDFVCMQKERHSVDLVDFMNSKPTESTSYRVSWSGRHTKPTKQAKRKKSGGFDGFNGPTKVRKESDLKIGKKEMEE